MPVVDAPHWNGFLESHPDAHFLQTSEWGRLKSEFGWEAIHLTLGASGVQILFRKLPFGFTIGYVGKAAVTQIQAADAEGLWSDVDRLCRHRRAIVCKFEPDAWEVAQGSFESGRHDAGGPSFITASPHNIQPRRTIVIDLQDDESAILARMKQKCRYNIRLAEKKGIRVRQWDDIAAFHRLLRATSERDAFAVHSEDYYRRAYEIFHTAGMAELLVAEYEGEPLAALMVFARRRRAWYVYGGSNDKERERMPNYLLQWEAMLWAKGRGCQEYDMWGVPDSDEQALEAGFEARRDGLWGVYRFKRGFGGEVRRAVQAIDRVYNPFLYRLYLRRAGTQPS